MGGFVPEADFVGLYIVHATSAVNIATTRGKNLGK
jgi:hypothetical protein